uniref:ribonuclease H n=1 Tax=Cyprinus carpio TaxID=7962 RepID=A0A8C1GDW5_CYPCA
MGLEKFMQQALRVDQRSQVCYREIPNQVFTPHMNLTEQVETQGVERMQVETSRLSQAERKRRYELKLCLYCGNPGHFLRLCPSRPPRLMVSSIFNTPSVSSPLTISVTLMSPSFNVSVSAIIDSGSAGDFISGELSSRLNLKRITTPKPYSIHAVIGEIINKGYVNYQIKPVILCVERDHQECFHPFILENCQTDIILGRPWLIRHQPEIDWKTGKIIRWGCKCCLTCLNDHPQITNELSNSVHVNSTSIESPNEKLSVIIPPCYSSFADVFSPVEASKLPPHRPWDCAIELMPGEPVPRGRIYSLSIPEQEAMQKYVQEALQQGYIRPSTSPAAASFFFVPKKDGGLRPCIDYRALNKITVKFSYPLPLVPSALEQLREATIFTKLDLRSAYNLIRIREGDEWKTAFITPA